MKNLLIISLVTFGILSQSYAQTEMKVNPIGLLYSKIDLGFEFGLSEDFGIEPRLIYDYDKIFHQGEYGDSNGFGVILEGKYYFGPQYGIDGFHIGMYTKFLKGTVNYSTYDVERTRLAFGFLLGYKWVSSRNIIFELGVGLGKAIVARKETNNSSVVLADYPFQNIDGTFKLAVGYRWPASSVEEKQIDKRKRR